MLDIHLVFDEYHIEETKDSEAKAHNARHLPLVWWIPHRETEAKHVGLLRSGEQRYKKKIILF